MKPGGRGHRHDLLALGWFDLQIEKDIDPKRVDARLFGDDLRRQRQWWAQPVGEQVGQVPQRIGGSAQDIGQTAERFIDESPLAVGAVALAIGTAIGLGLPTSRFEREMIGPASSRLLDSAEQTATQALREAREQVQDATSSDDTSPRRSTKGTSQVTGA